MNAMLNTLIQKLMGRGGSKDIAKKRLQFALVYDKLEVSEETLAHLQRDIVETISRYFEIDKDSVKLDISRSDDTSALVLSTPIRATRRAPQPMPARETKGRARKARGGGQR